MWACAGSRILRAVRSPAACAARESFGPVRAGPSPGFVFFNS